VLRKGSRKNSPQRKRELRRIASSLKSARRLGNAQNMKTECTGKDKSTNLSKGVLNQINDMEEER
jgi:hypothetical protein